MKRSICISRRSDSGNKCAGKVAIRCTTALLIWDKSGASRIMLNAAEPVNYGANMALTLECLSSRPQQSHNKQFSSNSNKFVFQTDKAHFVYTAENEA